MLSGAELPGVWKGRARVPSCRRPSGGRGRVEAPAYPQTPLHPLRDRVDLGGNLLVGEGDVCGAMIGSLALVLRCAWEADGLSEVKARSGAGFTPPFTVALGQRPKMRRADRLQPPDSAGSAQVAFNLSLLVSSL